METQTLLAIIVPCLTIATFFLTQLKGKREEGKREGRIEKSIEDQGRKFDTINSKLDKLDDKLDATADRLSKVEESCKSAHKRIDAVEKNK